jgi:hypothetical protein
MGKDASFTSGELLRQPASQGTHSLLTSFPPLSITPHHPPQKRFLPSKLE